MSEVLVTTSPSVEVVIGPDSVEVFFYREGEAALAAEASAIQSAASAIQSAASALTASTLLSAASATLAGTAIHRTKALANAALAGTAANAYVQVLRDETRSNRWTLYQKSGGVFVFVGAVTPSAGIWYLDPAIGSDTNDGMTPATPFLTMAKVLTVALDHDTVRAAPGAVLTEQWGVNSTGTASTYSTILNFEGDPGAPCVFQLMDKTLAAWTNDGTGNNTYTATIPHAWGGAGAKLGAGSAFAPRLLLGAEQLTEIRIMSSVADANTDVLTEAAALVKVRATPGTFYVQGRNGSNAIVGWESGDQVYYVHAANNAAPNAAGRQVSFGNRIAPIFNPKSVIKDVVIYGGCAHNGVVWRNCLIERASIYFPAHHAQFVGGSTVIDVMVYGANKTQGGFAFHSFDFNTVAPRGTKVIRPRIIDYWGGFNALFGCHGTGATGNPVVDMVEVHDLFGFNVASLGGGQDIKHGVVFHRPVLINSAGVDGGVTLTNGMTSAKLVINDGIMIQGSMANGQAFVRFPTEAAATLELNRCSIAVNEMKLLINDDASGGTVTFNDCLVLVKGDHPNARFIQNNGNWAALNFNRTIISTDQADDDHTIYAITNASATSPINLTDSHYSGLNFAGTGTLTQTRTTTGGRSHLFRDRQGATDLGQDHFRDLLGEVTIGVCTFNVNLFGSSSRNVYVLTNRSLMEWQNGQPPIRRASVPDGVTFNGCAYVFGSTKYVLCFGPNGTLYKSAFETNSLTQVAAGGRTTNWIAAVNTGSVDTAGKTWLLGSDGSITEYNALTDTFTDRTSGVAFPLTGGVMSGTTVLVWGGDEIGTAAGTAGGVRVSTDSGVTWAVSLANGDATPANIGTWAYRVRCGCRENGQFVLLGSKGTMLVSTTGASGSWTARALRRDIDVKFCAADDLSNGNQSSTPRRILIGGVSRQGGERSRTSLMGIINATDASTANWDFNTIQSPVSAVGGVAFVSSWTSGAYPSIFQWIAVGKHPEIARSEDGRSWVKTRPLPYDAATRTPTLYSMEANVKRLLPA